MAPSFFCPLSGHEQTLRDWLRLADHRHPEDPSLHDLLDLDESRRDRNLIKTRSVERGSLLRSLEQQVR